VKNKRKRTRRRPAPHAIRKRVKAMRASGLSEDRIAYELAVSKNTLRARHAPDLDAGRAAARVEAEAAERGELSARAAQIWQIVNAGFGTDWDTPDLGNLLHHGARNVRESFEQYLALKNRKIVDGFDDDADLAAVAGMVDSLKLG
jgi:hypothetical protein